MAAPMAMESLASAGEGRREVDAKASLDEEQNDKKGAGGEAPMVEPTIRTEFADTALWVGCLATDQDGLAQVELKMPENLTTWKARVWAMGAGTRVGEGAAEVVTTKNLILRLQAPRFFVEKDEVVLSANVHNLSQGEEAGPRVAGASRRLSQPDERRADADRCDRAGRREARGLARQGRQGRRGHDPHEGAHRRGIRRDGDEVPRLRPRHAQDRELLRRHPAREGKRPRRVPRPGRTQGRADAAGSPLVAHARRRDGGRAAVPGGLSLRLHRADARPVPAHGRHTEGTPADGAGPQGNPAETDQPERAGDRGRPEARRRLVLVRRLHEPRHRARQGAGLRPGRASRDGQGRHQPPGRHAVLRRRLGLVQRLGRAIMAAHHRVRRPRLADRPRLRRGAAAGHDRARRGLAPALPGRADPAHPQRREEGEGRSLEGARRQPRRLRLHGPRRRGREV